MSRRLIRSMDKMMGVMIDCSRNAVMNADSIKRYAKIIKGMGYNTLMLYTEDTYEVDNQPYFGHLRGRYSKSELKELSAYCDGIGIELVPCIQTLAHLENLFKWEAEYYDVIDCDDILLAGDEKTYKLIDDMLSTLSQCFTSRKIHIGMDEAYRVGTGKYKEIHGIQNRFDIINRHLHRVCGIAGKYGLEPMIWSDMFVKSALGIDDQYEEVNYEKISHMPPLPENISLVYWDYYSTDYNHYVKMIKANKAFGRKVYFAGSGWTSKGFCPDNSFAMETLSPAVKACGNEAVDGMFLTCWGDDGGECSMFSVLPALMYAAEIRSGNYDMSSIRNKFFNLTGCSFDTFMLLDEFDKIGGKHYINPSKYLLYNDPFMGIRDALCSADDGRYYGNLAQRIHNADGKGEFKYLFDSYEKLAYALEIKSCLGIRTREAYLKADRTAVREIAYAYEKLIERLNDFHKAYQKMWFSENKPHGFDVQDIRIGGLIWRIKSCMERLRQFADGTVDAIPELDEPVLENFNGRDRWCNRWFKIISANNVVHRLYK